MKHLIYTVVLAGTLPLVVSCDRGVNEEVVSETTKILDSRPAELSNREVSEGSAEVEYTAKRRVTQTVLQQEDIPTVQVCRSSADINKMDADHFVALGFDQRIANKIVEQRDQMGGRFNSVDDLSRIEGAAGQLAKIRDEIGVAPRQAQEE